jgi:hypothetical protein
MEYACPHRDIYYYFRIGHTSAGVQLYINRKRKELTNRIFDKLKERREEIESKFGEDESLEWQTAGSVATIRYVLPTHLNVFNENDWDKMFEFFVEYMPRLEAAVRDVLNEVLADEPESAIPVK